MVESGEVVRMRRVPSAMVLLLLAGSAWAEGYRPEYVRKATAATSFEASMQASRAAGATQKNTVLDYDRCAEEIIRSLARDFPAEQVNRVHVELDWAMQDGVYGGGALNVEAIAKVVSELGPAGEGLQREVERLNQTIAAGGDARWVELYRRACLMRRQTRLKPWAAKLAKLVFTKHYDLGGSHYAYTEGLSDAANERHFRPGTSLCVLEMEGVWGKVRTLMDDRKGVIRDPDVSWDGQRILFSWKKSDRQDDYHLYEMTAADGRIRQITSELGFADYEGQYLPNGDLIFSSTRSVQAVDCWWTEVSNMYTCGLDGRYLRRLGVDQVHTNFPTVMSDGRVIYTRWEYSDRGQIFVQGLFQMYPDGTGQTEFYGNNSWFPTSILHARGLPGSDRVVGILSGHHSLQKGWLAMVDPARGRQENSGVQLVAPVRKTRAERIDSYGQSGDQFQYPYPLSDTQFLVTFKPARSSLPFGVYYMDIDGRRELLAAEAAISCNQPIPLCARPVPPARPSIVDHRKKTGTVYMQDIYDGPGLTGVKRGAIKSLRVVALEYRAAAINSNTNSGPAGGALISTPISIEGTWDVKIVLGTTPVHEDGSACFIVPAKTPVYFQALDENNHAVQTMRSWATLQPGESLSCVGCHENKNSAPPSGKLTMAMKAGPKELAEPKGGVRGFSFRKEIQPILDAKCVSCHFVSDPSWLVDPRGKLPEFSSEWVEGPAENGAAVVGAEVKPAFSLRGGPGFWSPAYRSLANRRVANWINAQSEPNMLPPYHAGSTQSKLIGLLREGHYEVKLTGEEMDLFSCWIDLLVPYLGSYTECMNPRDLAKYEKMMTKRRKWEEQEEKNIAEFVRERGR